MIGRHYDINKKEGMGGVFGKIEIEQKGSRM